MASTSKYVSVVVLFFSTFLSGLVPYLVVRCITASKNLDTLIGRLNCFVGGIFFGTSLLTLLPEAREILSHALEDAKLETEYPVAEVLAGIGFLLVLILEHFVGVCHGIGNTHFHSHGDEKSILYNSKNKNKQIFIERAQGYNSASETDDNNKPGSHADSEPLINPKVKPKKEKKMGKNSESLAKIRTLILLLALSFHMIFDGLAIGLQKTETQVYTLLGTLTLHKCIVAFSVGLHLSSTLKKFKKLVIYMFFFSLVSPFGTIIGMVVTEAEGNQLAQDMASGVLQSVACGTFLYITFFEILLKELSKKHSLLNTLLTVSGFCVSAATNFLQEGH